MIAGIVFYFVLSRFELRTLWVIITACATAAIAVYAAISHNLAKNHYRLAREINSANELRVKSEDEFRQQVSDLYEAIVISNFIIPEANTARGGTLEGRIRIFKEYYKGKTEIF